MNSCAHPVPTHLTFTLLRSGSRRDAWPKPLPPRASTRDTIYPTKKSQTQTLIIFIIIIIIIPTFMYTSFIIR